MIKLINLREMKKRYRMINKIYKYKEKQGELQQMNNNLTVIRQLKEKIIYLMKKCITRYLP